jgi:hypothetical protein
MAYLTLLNNAIEALNLLLIQKFFYTYKAEIQLPGNGIWLLSRTQSSGYRVLPWLAIGDFYHIM